MEESECTLWGREATGFRVVVTQERTRVMTVRGVEEVFFFCF